MSGKKPVLSIGRWVAIGAFGAGMLLLFQGGWIQAKAWLAQGLLESAWQQTLVEGGQQKPWLWADHWPVARLSAPGQGKEMVVLEGDSGSVLAFAPGHSPQSGMPANERTVVISGHRDTHFRFLKAVELNDWIVLETENGTYRYRVDNREVVDSRQESLPVYENDHRLVLVTCWPFDATAAGGPYRFKVTATRAL